MLSSTTKKKNLSLGRFFFLKKNNTSKTLRDIMPPLYMVDDLDRYGLGIESYQTDVESVRIVTPKVDVTFQEFLDMLECNDPVCLALSESDIYELSTVEDFKRWLSSSTSQVFLFVKGRDEIYSMILSPEEKGRVCYGALERISSRTRWKAAYTPLFIVPSTI